MFALAVLIMMAYTAIVVIIGVQIQDIDPHKFTWVAVAFAHCAMITPGVIIHSMGYI
jgi:hypothetical protein